MQQVINAVVLGSCYCLFAVGLSLTWGTLNVLNLAHGAVFMFTAFSCYFITQKLDASLPVWTLVLVAVAVGAILEVGLDVFAFRPIRKRAKTVHDAELAMLIASIGAAAIPVTLAGQTTIDSPFSITPQAIHTTEFHFGGVYVTSIEIVIVAVAISLMVALAFAVSRTQPGRALRALAVDAETSGLMGISESRLSALALVVSGGTAGLAGVFLAIYLDSLTAQSGQDLLLKAFAAVVLGGVGSIWGTLVGAFVLAGGETLVTATTTGTWTDAVSFALIIVVLLVMPNGLFSRLKVDRV